MRAHARRKRKQNTARNHVYREYKSTTSQNNTDKWLFVFTNSTYVAAKLQPAFSLVQVKKIADLHKNCFSVIKWGLTDVTNGTCYHSDNTGPNLRYVTDINQTDAHTWCSLFFSCFKNTK